MSKPAFEDIFRFSGRRNRKSYILFSFAQLGLFAAIGVAFLITLSGNDATLQTLVGFLCLLAVIPVAVAGWAVAGQRCRDFGWTGWAILITLVPYIGWVFSIAIFFVPGTDGANRYGPDPLGSAAPRPVRIHPPLGSAALPG